MKIVKIILAILIGIAAMRMPYGYYQFVRLVAFIGFAFIAYESYKQKRFLEMGIASICAILFQPFSKIVLKKDIWVNVDIVIAVLLIISVIISFIQERRNKETPHV